MEKNQNANSNANNSQPARPELNLIGQEISGCVILEKSARAEWVLFLKPNIKL